MKNIRASSVVLAVALVLSFCMLGVGVRAHAEYVRLKNTVVTKPGAPRTVPANVRRAELAMKAGFVVGIAGLIGCMIATIVMGTVAHPRPRRGFDVIGGKGE